MNISAIRESLQNIDYAWNHPKTYLVLIPGVSLAIQKIQLAKVLPIPSDPSQPELVHQKGRQFVHICKWHLRGSMLQIMSLVIAVKFLAMPLIAWLALLPAYELADTLYQSLKNPVRLYEFHKNGQLKQVTLTSACTIF